MRPRVSWMNPIDESILEFMGSAGDVEGRPIAMTPRVIQKNLESRDLVEKSMSTYSRRMKALADAGLLKRLEGKGAYYEITDLGTAYVEGELGAEELEDLV